MELRNYGITRRELRQGGGRGNGSDHFEDLIGSTEFYIYYTPDKKVKGYESLKLYLEAEGCEVIYTTDAPVNLGSKYDIQRITRKKGDEIPVPVLRRAHAWAHQRNLLHSFFKPAYR